MCSAFFVFTWLIVRNMPLGNRIQSLVKPIIISQAYMYCILMNQASSRGPLNPTLAFELWIWGMGAYSDKMNPKDDRSQTIFEAGHYGRYIWVYVFASLLGGAIGGFGYHVWEQ